MASTYPTHQLASCIIMNFQSWTNTEQSIALETDVVNNIQGSNETGKSVIFKILYDMYFPGYHDISELIRDGAECGLLFMALTDGSQLIYECHWNFRKFYLEVPGEPMQEWQQQSVPTEITDALGFIVDYEHQIILNVIDSDIPLPFIKTNPKYNASLLKSLIEPDLVKKFYENCQAYLLEITTAKLKYEKQVGIYYSQYQTLEYVDVFLLKHSKQKAEEISEILSKLIVHFNAGIDLIDIQSNAPIYIANVCAIAEPYIEASRRLNKVLSCVEVLAALYTSAPAIDVKDPSSVHVFIESAQTLTEISQIAQRTSQLYARKPDVINCPTDIHTYLAAIQQVDAVSTHITQVKRLSHKQDLCDKLVTVTSTAVSNLEHTLGVCPTCGREFE